MSGKFERKSLTILPVTLSQTSRYSDELLKGVLILPQTSRFDYNNISTKSIKEFESEFRKAGYDPIDPTGPKSIEAIKKSIINSALEPVVKIVCNQDSIDDRFKRQQKRVVTSAASSGKISTTSDKDAMILINGSFIPVVVLNSVETKDNTATAIGTVFWYRIDASEVTWDFDNQQKNGGSLFPTNFKDVKINFVGSNAISNVGIVRKKENKEDKSAAGKLLGAASKEIEESPEDAKLSADQKAVKGLPGQIIKVAYTMEDFKIRGVVQSVDPDYTIDVGKKEDAYMDQGYKIYETRLGNDKKPYSVYTGFIRVDKIGNNVDNIEDSRAYSIIASGIEQGHVAISHDQGLDFYIRPSYKMINIPKEIGRLRYNSDLYTENVGSSINIDAGLFYNLAKVTNISQLFVGINASFGIPNATATDVFDGTTQSTFQFDLSIMKKLWLSRFNVYGEVNFGVNSFSIGNLPIFNSDSKLTIATGLAYGAGVNAGLEYAFSPDLNIGVQAGYRYVLPSTTVTTKVDDGEKTEYLKENNLGIWSTAKLDDLNLGGLNFGLRVSYSLPPFF
ncbi:MAG: hypothetical protein ACO3B0_06820 [Chitinophagaceae bacterium]